LYFFVNPSPPENQPARSDATAVDRDDEDVSEKKWLS
jgi:hypothetical protein